MPCSLLTVAASRFPFNTMSQFTGDSNSSPLVTFEPMAQQLDVRSPGDDWTGVTSSKERRKLQNRLNQRLYSESAC